MTRQPPHPPSRTSRGTGLMQAYYLATPLFFVADLAFSLPIRVAALADPGLRYLYYAFALGCGVAARARPRAAPYLGLAESSLNILLLILAIMLPILQLPDRVFAGEPMVAPLSGLTLANFILSGTVLVAAFHVHQADILRGRVGSKW